MLPFLLLSHRPEDEAAHAEHHSFRRIMGLRSEELVQVRMNLEQPELDFADYSGIILGGGPFNNTDMRKSVVQRQVEAYVTPIVSRVVAEDFPFLGACYGIGVVGSVVGASLTPEGARDPLLAGMPALFDTLVGHVEAVETLPNEATCLVNGTDCPVQMFKVGSNVYATQFHPELELRTFIQRLQIYADNGYYEPYEYDAIVAGAAAANLETDNLILRNFRDLYAR